MAKKEAAKNEVKKQRRRMKKSVRKTLGALFLASAVAVAAIPTENLEARNDSATRTAPSETPSSAGIIPQFTASDSIYITGDGLFRFALKSDSGAQYATILGFTTKSLDEVNGAVEIPPTVVPYMKFTNSYGTSEGYVAVGQNNNFLFWEKSHMEDKRRPEGDYDPNYPADPETGYPEEAFYYHEPDGSRTQEKVIDSYEPCFASTVDQWGNLGPAELFYDSDQPVAQPGQGNLSLQPDKAIQTTNPSFQKIEADVVYIGNQYLVDDAVIDGVWHVGGNVIGPDGTPDPTKGVFAGAGNIKALTISSKLLGIGEYAFYQCGALGLSGDVVFGDGVETIGEGAFYDCVNVHTVTFPIASRMKTIGAKAFYNCQALKSFTMPLNVTTIGDSAFEGCIVLKEMDLLSGGANNMLQTLGRDVFKNCRSLENITFPRSVTGNVYLSIFDGCQSLQWISTRNETITFVEDGNAGDPYYGYDDFKAMLGENNATVNGTFYFRGIEGSALHKMTEKECFAFGYIDIEGNDLNKYELTVQESEDLGGDNDGRAHYVVNNNNQMIEYRAAQNVDQVTIPSKIGPYTVSTIESQTFQTKCFIVKVYIPANVTSISADAFKGCHRLRDVIFESGNVVIGDNAFRTQDAAYHQAGCGGVETETDTNAPKVKLHFSGPISYDSGPFQYAMSGRGEYSSSTQATSYIIYYSGWPQNMEIQYNPETGLSELVDFPSLSELSGTKYNSDDYVYISDDMETAMRAAVEKKISGATMSPYEKEIVDAAIDIVIPEGVESIRDGLFKEKENQDIANSLRGITKTVKAYSVKRITSVEEGSVSDGDGAVTVTGTFAGCSQITKIELLGGVEALESHAFMDCTGLTDVTLPPTLYEMGIRPFAGCSRLATVNFLGGPFECDNSIIYELSNGTRTKVVECLEGRSNPRVTSDELAGITELYPEAFMGGTKIINIDLSESSVSVIPNKAFMNNTVLAEVTLPRLYGTGRLIQEDAFSDCPTLVALTIPEERAQINEKAFGGTTLQEGKVLWFYCEPGSDAALYADDHNPYIQWQKTKPIRYFEVRFGYLDDLNAFVQIGETQSILEGEAATPPADSEVPVKEGYVFTGWAPTDYLAVYKAVDITAQYALASDVTHTVTFLNDDLTPYYTQTVKHGESPIPMAYPYWEGHIFIGWVEVGGDGSLIQDITTLEVLKDMTLKATYRLAQNGEEDDGSGTQTKDPNATDDPNGTGDPNGTQNPNGTQDPNGGNGSGSGTTGPFYILTVQNGSGSGSYHEGDQPIIIANDPASGQEFDYWTISPTDTKIASLVLPATIVTMPAGDVTVTAHYKVKTSSGVSGTGSTGSSNNNRPNGSGSSGTTVVIDKNGLSNTGVVSATVNGSSDNFTIKITESNAATEAALRALLAEYGSLDNLVYFPMDISLYDSTGTRKITDTTGLSVTITLPLPDSMITYAGNNQVAGVVNDKLDRLSARFSTIQGVSCITFTATHFSPYVIYVDTGNLSSGLVSDSTPQTGDRIHPKWFLSIGLACLSFVFFMQTDSSRKPKKVKVKVKA